MEQNEFELIVSQGKRPFWQRLVAAVFFTMMLYYVFWLTMLLWNDGLTRLTSKRLPAFGETIGYLLAGGIGFSVTKTVLIDVDKDKLISRFCIGPFSRDVLSKVPELQYVSVFLDGKEFYQVNLWYKGNKHYKMYAFDKKSQAMEFATLAAARLKIDLLDATEKGNSKWIEQEPS